MTYEKDKRIVATLDAGGTNFVFSAIQGNQEIVEQVRIDVFPDNLDECLQSIKRGFYEVISRLPSFPAAISFVFPGPADYENGIIGDLPNFPAFRGGVALGAMLEKEFNIPVFINNDGSLFAYGEALAGSLVSINKKIIENGGSKQYKNLLGVTLGTGFGGGAVINRELLIGDNGCGGDVWIFRNKKHRHCFVEESVSKRAVSRIYKSLSGDKEELTPEDIFHIAEGAKQGNRDAAIKSFEELGEMAGDVIAMANTIVDGIVVIGGGLTGASKYIIPSLVSEINEKIFTLSGESFPRSQVKAYNLENETGNKGFFYKDSIKINIPGTTESIDYVPVKKTGVMVSKLGASKAIALGAYAYALHKLDSNK